MFKFWKDEKCGSCIYAEWVPLRSHGKCRKNPPSVETKQGPYDDEVPSYEYPTVNKDGRACSNWDDE